MFYDDDKYICDFDEIKKEFCKKENIENLSSCDGLYYKEYEFYFIEFKDIEKILRKNLPIKNIRKSIKKFIKNNFYKKNLLKKIDESKYILDTYLYKLKKRDIKLNSKYFYYIIVSFPLSPSKNIFTKLKLLSYKPTFIKPKNGLINENIEKELQEEINNLNNIYFLEECKYLSKEDFLSKKLFWKSKECKGV